MSTTKENLQVTYRKTAITVGILFILGTAAGVLSVIFLNPVSNANDYFAAVMANKNQVILGAIFILTMGLTLAMIPVVLFPLLKKYNEALAIGYVVFRGSLETVTYLAMVICWLLLVFFAQGIAKTTDASAFQNIGTILMEVQDAINLILIIIFSLGALILYYLLYTSKLIPRWISVWGVIAILLHLSTSFLDMFGFMSISMSGDTMAGVTFILNFPIFLQEMLMAVWLIVKGFSIKPS